ncbi:UNVERIFIED_CONTAM: Retrovirus-related Pol polyprotein from transposon TNT 1-94 [Sesamum calycinum]|uniref:Retrovirus-related Pol polyprotein from transposon TNT 1-94 n=1 Tax=Sesamum calycinum TaxID=2727403 RepID=A0AAW2N3H7_9LAMI
MLPKGKEPLNRVPEPGIWRKHVEVKAHKATKEEDSTSIGKSSDQCGGGATSGCVGCVVGGREKFFSSGQGSLSRLSEDFLVSSFRLIFRQTNSGIRAGPSGTGVTTKMKGILIQQKVFKSNDGKYAENVSDDKKRDNDDDVKAAIKYGRDNVCLDTVINGLKSKEMDIKTNKTSQPNNEVNMKIFTTFKPGKFGSVSMANQKRCDIQGLGDVCLTFSDGYKLTLRNVRYVPDLNHNLMSCAALEEEGLEGRWGKGIMKIMKGSLTVFKADRRRNLKWKILVENQTGKKLKVLRTDNGLEFCNQSFSNLCDECGIKRHKTNPYTPQQNGVAERMNRTLLEKVRCMLISSGLPKSFWGEALVTAAYLINRSPSVPLNGKIPESVWTGHAVDISSLRVFGCSAFVHQSVDKLAPRSQKCVFIVILME